MDDNQSVRKAVLLLQTVSRFPAGANSSELGRLTGVPRPTARRLAATLADLGLLYRRENEDAYVLGPELARLGLRVDVDTFLVEAATPPLDDLLRKCHETVNLTVPRRTYLDVIMQLESPKYAMGTNFMHRSVPLHASSAGKVFLASLAPESVSRWLKMPLERFTDRTIVTMAGVVGEIDKTQARGYAESLDEIELGLTTISVPVRDSTSELVAIASVSGPTARLNRALRISAVAGLRQAAREITQRLELGAGASLATDPEHAASRVISDGS